MQLAEPDDVIRKVNVQSALLIKDGYQVVCVVDASTLAVFDVVLNFITQVKSLVHNAVIGQVI